MVETTQNKHNKIILFLMAITFAIFFVSSPLTLLVNAESNRVTSVIEDLQTDPDFSVENYPSITPTKPEDYNLQVIQIAESTAKELFIYVYQPTAVTKELKATSINISTSIGENFSPKNYTLTFLNSRGVFQKYVVNDFYVKNDALRYYDIISIFRAFNETIDKKPGADQTISERSYEVGQLWTACTVNNEVSYNYETEETIEVIDKFVGFVRYYTSGSPDHNIWLSGRNYACDRHFVAFSTDKNIDELIEADLEYQTQIAKVRSLTGGTTLKEEYGTINNAKSNLKIDDERTINASITTGLFITNNFTYSWNDIQTSQQFLDSVNTENIFTNAIFNSTVTTKVNSEISKDIKNKQWVLSFDNTKFSHEQSTGVIEENRTIVSNVTILRLKFKTAGVTYNLGVVDNKQSGSQNPINTTIVTKDWGWLMQIIVKVLKIIFYVIIGIIVIKVITVVVDLIKAIFSKRR